MSATSPTQLKFLNVAGSVAGYVQAPARDAKPAASSSVSCTVVDSVVAGRTLLSALQGEVVSGVTCKAPAGLAGVALRASQLTPRAAAPESPADTARNRDAEGIVSAVGAELTEAVRNAERENLENKLDKVSRLFVAARTAAQDKRAEADALRLVLGTTLVRQSANPHNTADRIAVRVAQERQERAEAEAQKAEALLGRLAAAGAEGLVAGLKGENPKRLRDVAALYADVSLLASGADAQRSELQLVLIAPDWHKGRAVLALAQSRGAAVPGSKVDANARLVLADALALDELFRAARVVQTAWSQRTDESTAAAELLRREASADVAYVDPNRLWALASARLQNELSWYEALVEPNPEAPAESEPLRQAVSAGVASALSYQAPAERLVMELRKALSRANLRADADAHEMRVRIEAVYAAARAAGGAELAKLRTRDDVPLQLANR